MAKKKYPKGKAAKKHIADWYVKKKGYSRKHANYVAGANMYGYSNKRKGGRWSKFPKHRKSGHRRIRRSRSSNYGV